ncbi:ATP-binding protein [Streptomyces antimycoticus]|uniref:ATP-binding protein n=1 Tax=Streptomyces TaxID=1883 RepID=UPI00342FB97B
MGDIGHTAPEGLIMYSATLPRTARSAAIALPAEASQVRTARRFITAHLTRWRVAEEDRYRAELIVSELAGNAARHGGTDMTVHLSLVDRDIRVDVSDTGRSVSPWPDSTTHPDEAGRGLYIVDRIADWTVIRPRKHGWQACAGIHAYSPCSDGRS